jgi:hypothetical protein
LSEALEDATCDRERANLQEALAYLKDNPGLSGMRRFEGIHDNLNRLVTPRGGADHTMMGGEIDWK